MKAKISDFHCIPLCDRTVIGKGPGFSGLNLKSGPRSGFKIKFLFGSKISGLGRPARCPDRTSIFKNFLHEINNPFI